MNVVMEDQSHLDAKYFIDPYVYNCPFCKRRNVYYSIDPVPKDFDWSNNKTCTVIFVKCTSCAKTSMHLTHDRILTVVNGRYRFLDISISTRKSFIPFRLLFS